MAAYCNAFTRAVSAGGVSGTLSAMRYYRTVLAVSTFVSVATIVGGTIAYGVYFRGEPYRQRVESDLTRFFGLPVDVGAVRPYGFASRVLQDIRVYLPQRRARVFAGPRIVWDRSGDDGVDGAVLHLHDADWLVDAPSWLSEDYMRVLKASLAQNLKRAHVGKVYFHQSRFRWRRDGYELVAEEVDGSLVFDEQGRGKAKLTCHRLNGTTVNEPIQIFAQVDPHRENFLPEVTLVVPQMKLADLALDGMLGPPVKQRGPQSQPKTHEKLSAAGRPLVKKTRNSTGVAQGTFAGRLVLRQKPGDNEIELSGRLNNVQLEELTAISPIGPVPARIDLNVARALFRNRRLDHIVFSGEIRDLDVDVAASRLGLPKAGGTVHLAIQRATIRGDELLYLNTSGYWDGGSLDVLTSAWLEGDGIEGCLRVRLRSLVVESGVPVSGTIDVSAVPGAGAHGVIERELLLDLIQRQFGLRLPEQLLAPKIEYTHMGARFVIDANEVRVLAVDGPVGRSMITILLYGQQVPLLGNADLTFPTEPLLHETLAKWRAFKEQMRLRLKKAGIE